MPYREQKLTEAIKDAVAEIILEDLVDPNLGLVTITAAKLTKDYKKITIYFSALGNNEQKVRSLKSLNRAANFIQGHLKNKVKLRYTPKLVFEIDHLLEQEQRIGKVIDELHKSETKPTP
ncbi:MAG: 30S ribosome-binding factor RbfA [candidate division WOR-3 bacterium]